MTGPRVTDAKAAAAELTALGVRATVDPAWAASNLPCVLFLPPTLRFAQLGGGAQVDWRLAVLAEGPPGLDCWDRLDTLLEQLAEHVNITTADPGVYALSGDKNPIPAYLCVVQD